MYYDLFVMLDIYSRYAVGWQVAAAENGELAEEFIADAIARTGAAPRAIHADRGFEQFERYAEDWGAELFDAGDDSVEVSPIPRRHMASASGCADTPWYRAPPSPPAIRSVFGDVRKTRLDGRPLAQ